MGHRILAVRGNGRLGRQPILLMRYRRRIRRFYLDELGDWIFGYAWPVLIFYALVAIIVTVEGEWWGLIAWTLVACFGFLPPLYNV